MSDLANLANTKSVKKENDIKKQIEQIEMDRNEMDSYRRFGFFTIPYPATVGDQAYSRTDDKKKTIQIVDGKIKTENRNIFVAPLKKGKGPDVYFQRVEPEPDETIEKHKKMNEIEYKEMIKNVNKRKEKQAKVEFKPTGPQELFGFYRDTPTPEPTGTLYITPNPKRFILEGYKVKTENRGIFTNPTKTGFPHPNDYFDFYRVDEPTQERLDVLNKKDIEDKLNKVKLRKKKIPDPRPPFSPASLKKCEPFSSIVETYGIYTDAEKEEKLKEYYEFKKKGNPKFVKSLPKGSVNHLRAFSPARLIWTGRDGLFDDNLYTLPELTEKDKLKNKIKTVKEKKEEEERMKPYKRNPFTYNKLMKTSKFSPAISSFTLNLKKEFPTIKFH